MLDNISLSIEGIVYSGWTDITIHKSLSALSGTFRVTMADDTIERDWSFVAEKVCTIQIGSDRIMTGIIDGVDISIEEESHEISIFGREMTADLIDCSVVADRNAKPHNGMISNCTIVTIVSELLKSFPDIQYRLGPGVSAGAKFTRFSIQKGETNFEAIDRAAKQRGLILLTDEKGSLILSVSGVEKSADVLKYGVNVKTASAHYDYANRFSHYRVESQSDSGGDHKNWKPSTYVYGLQKDESVNRFRPLILSAEAQSTSTSCKSRARLEALHRAASSQQYVVTVTGWRQLNKQLWKLNHLVSVDIPKLFVQAELLIGEISYSLSENGSLTTMTLVRKDAFNDARSLEALSDKIRDQKGVPTQRFNVN